MRRPRGRPKSAFTARDGAVQALDRALVLLEHLAASDGLTLSEVAVRTGVAPSTAHRLLATLAAHGFAGVDDVGQRWGVGLEAFRVGSAYLRRAEVPVIARPVMRTLMEASGETVNLGLYDAGEVVFISQVESAEAIRAFFRTGERRAAHASGIGKALLAHLPRADLDRLIALKGLEAYTPRTLTDPASLRADLEATRQRGWSVDDEERNAGMRCIAAAIFNPHAEAVAGISISGPSARITPERLAGLGPLVRDAASRITRAIGGVTP